MSKVLVVVLNWRNWRDTQECLKSVVKSQGVALSVVVLENGSMNESWNELNQLMAALNHSPYPITLLQSANNLGFAQGLNHVVEAMKAEAPDYYYFLNNDAQVAADTLARAIAFSQNHRIDFLNSLSVKASDGKAYFLGARHPWHLFGYRKAFAKDLEKRAWPTDFCEGAGLLLSRQMVEASLKQRGFLFSPEFFMYGEDSDLGFYLKSQGIQGWIIEDSKIIHKVSAGTGGPNNPRVLYYITRNRIFLANRWLRPSVKILFHLYYIPSRLLLSVKRVVRGEFQLALACLEGLWDGYSSKGGQWRKHQQNETLYP